MRARYRTPEYRHGWPDDAMLASLVAEYTQITGDPVRSAKKAGLIAGCYGVHGRDGFIQGVTVLFGRSGTAVNLLGELLLTPDIVLAAIALDDPEAALAGGDTEPAAPAEPTPAVQPAPQPDSRTPGERLTLFAEFDEVPGSPGARALQR